MDDTIIVPGRYMRGQPFNQPVHISIATGDFVALILPRPARYLTIKIIADLAEVAQAKSYGIETMQLRQRRIHSVEISGTFFARNILEARIPEYPPLDTIHDV